MARRPRHLQVRPHTITYYHTMSRCVRKMKLLDDVKRKDFMLSWLKQLHAAYAVEVCRYSMMGNHFHLILRINLEMAQGWAAREVVERWARLHPPRDWGYRPLAGEALEGWIANQARIPEMVEKLREKLVNLGQFMKDFKQRVAEAFNKADEASGVFWGGRYTCVPIESESQLLACMTYVDLNPHAAGQCERPEDDPHTSLHESVRSREKERQQRVCAGISGVEQMPPRDVCAAQAAGALAQESVEEGVAAVNPAIVEIVPNAERHAWGVPVARSSVASRGGMFADLRLEDYLRLVDFVARRLRDGKAKLDDAVAGILQRTRVEAGGWLVDIGRAFAGGARMA